MLLTSSSRICSCVLTICLVILSFTLGYAYMHVNLRNCSLFTVVLTFDDGLQAEDEDSSSLPHLDGFSSNLPPGILKHGLPQVKEVQPAVTAVEQQQEKKEVKEGESGN